MLEKLELKWKKRFRTCFGQPCIIIQNIPKGEIRKLAKRFNVQPTREGIWEILELDLGTVSIKLKRVVKNQ